MHSLLIIYIYIYALISRQCLHRMYIKRKIYIRVDRVKLLETDMTWMDDNKKITKLSKLRSPLDVVFEKIKRNGIHPPGRLSGKILKDLLTSDDASFSYSSQEDSDGLVKDEMPDCVDLVGSVADSESGIRKKGFLKEIKKLEESDSLKMPKLGNPWTQRIPVKKYQDAYEVTFSNEKDILPGQILDALIICKNEKDWGDVLQKKETEAEVMKDQKFKRHNGKGRSRSVEALGGVWVMELENVVSGERKFEDY